MADGSYGASRPPNQQHHLNAVPMPTSPLKNKVDLPWDQMDKGHNQGKNVSLSENNGSTDSVDVGRPIARRARSNSRSAGSSSMEPLEQDFANKMIPSVSQKSLSDTSLSDTSLQKDRYTNILVLKSLNGTFEKKYLAVPFQPEVIKLGRPVVNNGPEKNENNNVTVRSNFMQVKPDNGNFNSRVLSRNHAAITCNASTGKIYIVDLNSSNGTFINGTRIGHEEVELRIGDVIDLGTDIDMKHEHRRISALVEDISMIALVNETVDILTRNNHVSTGTNGVNKTDSDRLDNESFLPHDAIASKIGDGSYIQNPTISAQRAAFEAAMFGDVNNVNLGNAILGSETELLSGIFINSSLGTSNKLINVMKILTDEIASEKRENAKLKSMENFLVNFVAYMDTMDSEIKSKNKREMLKLQNKLKKKLHERHIEVEQEQEKHLKEARDEFLCLQEGYQEKEKLLKKKLFALKEDFGQLKQSLNIKDSDDIIHLTNENDMNNKAVQEGDLIEKSQVSDHTTISFYGFNFFEKSFNWKGPTVLIASAVFVGSVAYALNISSYQLPSS